MQTHPNDDEAYLASRTRTLRSQGRIPHKGKLVLDESTQPTNEAYQLFGMEVPTSVMLQDKKTKTKEQNTHNKTKHHLCIRSHILQRISE